MKLRKDYGEMYCAQHGVGPTGGYCLTKKKIIGSNEYWDPAACNKMAEIFARSSVLDLGCGLGWYGKCLEKAGRRIRWTGFDGAEGVEKATGMYYEEKLLHSSTYW